MEKMYKRYLGLSLKEISIIVLGLIGCYLLFLNFGCLWWKKAIVLYALGLCFESMMAPLFTYAPAIRDRHCINGSDVNFVLPLGWLEVAATTSYLAHTFFPSHLFLGYVGVAFVIGNIHEFLFYKLGFWMYNYDKAMVGNYKPLMPKITISGVPVQVIIGYCNVGIFSWFILTILTKVC